MNEWVPASPYEVYQVIIMRIKFVVNGVLATAGSLFSSVITTLRKEY